MTKSRYTKAPMPPPELEARFQKVLEVLSGTMTVSEAARQLGWSRNHFQSVLNTGLTGLLEALAPKPPGPKAKSPEVAELQERVRQLEEDNSFLEEKLSRVDKLMGLTSELMRGQRGRGRRAASTPPKPKATTNEDDEPHGRALAAAQRMKAAGAPARWAACAIGTSASTLRRWSARAAHGQELSLRRGPPPGSGMPANTAAAEEKVRVLRGCIGAAALAHSDCGLSRRQAAAVLTKVRTELEVERKAALTRIHVMAAGLMRGFDAMFALTVAGLRPVLVSADAAVPYRTQLMVAEHYDELAVAAALAADFERNGAPLVLRMDRAKQHATPRVTDVLDAHGVLVLHGPPHCPRYYGQLERQNREHQAWLTSLGLVSVEQLVSQCALMQSAFNDELPRRSLGWLTASEVWGKRADLNVDRLAFREEVEQLRRKLDEEQQGQWPYADAAQRFAIEATLKQHGLLRGELGGWC
jgi:transposase-like protein